MTRLSNRALPLADVTDVVPDSVPAPSASEATITRASEAGVPDDSYCCTTGAGEMTMPLRATAGGAVVSAR